MLDLLRRAFGMNPQASGGRDAGVPAKDFAGAFDTQGNPLGQMFELEQRRAEQEALARARGYPSAEALLAAEPDLIPDSVPPLIRKVLMHDAQGNRMLVPEAEANAIPLDELASAAESWLGPLDNPSRMIGAAITGQNPLDVFDSTLADEDRPPTIGGALVSRGAPEWAGLLAEVMLVPDPIGAGRATDLLLLTSLIPGFRGLRSVSKTLNDLAAQHGEGSPEFIRGLLDATPGPGRGATELPDDLRALPPELGPQEIRALASEVRQRAVNAGTGESAEAARRYSERLELFADVMDFRADANVVSMPEASHPSLAALEGIGRMGGMIPAGDALTRFNAINTLVRNIPVTLTPEAIVPWLRAVSALGDETGLGAAKLADWLENTVDIAGGADVPMLSDITRSLTLQQDALKALVQARGLRRVSLGEELSPGELEMLRGNLTRFEKATDNTRALMQHVDNRYQDLMWQPGVGSLTGPAMRYYEDALTLLSDVGEDAARLNRNLNDPIFNEPPTRAEFEAESAANVELEGVGGGVPPAVGDNGMREWLDSMWARIQSNYGFDKDQFRNLPPDQQDIYLDDLDLSNDARRELLKDLRTPESGSSETFTIPVSPEEREFYQAMLAAGREARNPENWTPVELMDAIEERWGSSLDDLYAQSSPEDFRRMVASELRVMGVGGDKADELAEGVLKHMRES